MVVVAGTLSFGSGTSSSQIERPDVRRAGWTTSGVTDGTHAESAVNQASIGTDGSRDRVEGSPRVDTATLVVDLRNRSGLTWDQLASIFGVERRSVHFWASGRTMNASNAERLARVLAAVSRIDCGDPAVTRALLLTPTETGEVPLDLLREDRLSELSSMAAPPAFLVKRAPPISPRAAASRAPRPPHQLLGAARDLAGASPGKLIRAKRLTPKKLT
jgi:DNA-binding transcriptional regulator YiaG